MGVIVGSGYHVNPKSLGYRTCTYVGIKLEKGSMYKSVVAELQKIPEIVECHFTTGPYTMLTKLYACDNEHLMDLLNNKMQEIPGVVATETLISLEQSIKKEIPIRVERISPCRVIYRNLYLFDYRPFSPCCGKGRILLGHQMLVDIPDTRHCRCSSIVKHRQCDIIFFVRRICLFFLLDHQRGL